MKREFLQNLKVGEETLPKEVVDAIMAENGRDIEAAKAAQMLSDGKTAQQWKEEYEKAVSEHQKQLDGITFQNLLNGAIAASGGKNAKAITALLDLEALRDSENRQEAIEKALQNLQAEESYLFGKQTPPPYARGTGTQGNNKYAPTDLAGALREKFERK